MKKRIIALIAIFLLSLLFYLSSYPFGCEAREEVIIIGLDGGSWNVILPLIREGKLTNLNKLMNEGVYGGLNSDDSLDTSAIWKSIATSDVEFEAENNTIWEILSENGKVVGVSYWPYVSKINGYIIPAYYERYEESYPTDMYDSRAEFLLRNPVIEFLRKSYYMKILIPADRMDKDILYDFYLLDYKSREFFYLRDRFKPDVSAIVFYGPDRLQHYLWVYATPDKFQNVNEEKIKKYGNIIENYYKEFDKFIGRVMNCNKDATIFIISGYGFDATVPPKVVDEILVNDVLEKVGLLKFDYRGEIDMFHTKAYSLDDEMEDRAFIKIKTDEDVKKQVKDMFSSILVEGTSQNIFTVTETDEGVILHRNVPLQLGNVNIVVSNNVYPIQDFIYRRIISGRRTRDGILIANGKKLKKGKIIYNSKIYDIAPTILRLYGLDAPENMSGKVLDVYI